MRTVVGDLEGSAISGMSAVVQPLNLKREVPLMSMKAGVDTVADVLASYQPAPEGEVTPEGLVFRVK